MPDRIAPSTGRPLPALMSALVADPRNPHLIPALIDYFERAERPDEARLVREFRGVLVALAEELHRDRPV